MTCFGTSASYIASCMKAGVEPGEGRDLSALRSVGSTGSPLSPEGFAGSTTSSARDIWLFSTSGGTDVCTAFVGGVPTLPVHRGELQARALGAAVEAFDEDGRRLVDEVGELVITEPMPSMPRLLLERPRTASATARATSTMYPGVWRHGDWIEITDARHRDHLRPLRLDDQPRRRAHGHERDLPRGARAAGGRRRARRRRPARGRRRAGCRCSWCSRDGATLDDELIARDRARVREDCSPRHVPDEVFAVAEVPRTLSRQGARGPGQADPDGRRRPSSAASRDSLANPAALDWFVELAAARG